MSSKIGFWAVFALVTGSQIGSGVFLLPTSLAAFGKYGIIGWFVSGIGAVLLALVFAQLCMRIPKTGGPHVYVQKAFGPTPAFFTGWTYWIISWVSSTAVIITTIGYLTPFIGVHSPMITVIWQIILLFIITALNLRGVKATGSAEFILTIIKIIPLILLPAIALVHFNPQNITPTPTIEGMDIFKTISRVTLLTLWGFIGLEAATTPAGSVREPSKTIPSAIIFGTLTVAIIYGFNSLAIMGIVPSASLMTSHAPYADAANILFGGHWYLLISFFAFIICAGTLIAWMLTSSQIALGLAQDGLMPSVFKRENKFSAPYYSLITSCFGIVPLLILTLNANIAEQIMTIIDISVTAFLFVYVICTVSFLKLLKNQTPSPTKIQWFYGFGSLIFCLWILSMIPIKTLLIASFFVMSGLPIYIWQKTK